MAKTADNNNNLIVVSGSQDRILKTWKGEYNNAKKKKAIKSKTKKIN